MEEIARLLNKNINNTDTTEQSLFHLQDSFGYACNSPQSIALLGNVLLVVSGRILHVLEFKENYDEPPSCNLQYCSTDASSIGCIATNSREGHVAVGEVGSDPSILIYQWPSFKMVAELKEGTQKAYVSLDYSPDGEIVCSQGGHPDLTLALWNWKCKTLILTCRPSELPIYRTAFSCIQPDIIITGGENHIGFWRMTKTFTGLKIAGGCGKFGSTKVTDVQNFECLPNGKVVSSCSWGNILVWNNGAIEQEITSRRKNVPCHAAPIQSFHNLNNSLISIGCDGWVRLWEIGRGQRELSEDGCQLSRQEAVIYFRIAKHTRLLDKVNDPTVLPGNEVWFLQDGNGAVWRSQVGAALRGEVSRPAVSRVLRCHRKGITAASASPHSPHLATLGKDGRLIIRSYLEPNARSHVIERECHLPGSKLLWLPVSVDPSGSHLLVGFAKGVVALMCFAGGKLRELQAFWPHVGPVTAFTAAGKLVASGGEDGNVCVMDVLSCLTLRPRGLLTTPSHVTSLHFRYDQEQVNLLVCCKGGQILEFELPSMPKMSSDLHIPIKPKRILYASTMSEVMHLENDKDEIMALLGHYTDDAFKVVLVLGGLKGWSTVCELNLASGSLTSWNLLPTPAGAKLTCVEYAIDGSCLVLGFDTGEVQVSLRDSDLLKSPWSLYSRLVMHSIGETDSRQVTCLALSYDLAYMFSCGEDGNEFVYRLLRSASSDSSLIFTPPTETPRMTKKIGLPSRNLTLTMAEIKKLKEDRKTKKIIKKKKANILLELKELKEKYINLKEKVVLIDLPDGIWPNMSEDLHPQLSAHHEAEIAALNALVLGDVDILLKHSEETWSNIHQHFITKLHSDSLKSYTFNGNKFVRSYRLYKLTEDQLQEFEDVKNKFIEENERKGTVQSESEEKMRMSEGGSTCSVSVVEAAPKRAPEDRPATSLVLERLKRHRERRAAHKQKIAELDAERPVHDAILEENKEDATRVREAENNIGYYRLKCDAENQAPPDLTVSPIKTQYQIVQATLEIHRRKDEFNHQVFALKTRKRQIIERWSQLAKFEQNLKQFSDIMILLDEEKPERDLLTLCGGPGSDSKLSQIDIDEFESACELEAVIKQYDDSVHTQIVTRAQLDVEISLLQLRCLGLRQEAIILEEFAPREKALELRIQNAKVARKDLEKKLGNVNELLRRNKRIISDLNKQEREIERRFLSEAGSSPNCDILMTLLKSKPPSLSAHGSGAASSFDSETCSAETPSSRKRSVAGSIYSLASNPRLLAFTHQLREERFQVNQKIDEENKKRENLKNEQEIFLKKIKLVDKSITSINEDIYTFQRARQSSFDSLEEVVPLKLHQLPADARLADCVLMPTSELLRLQCRAQQLRDDTSQLENEYAYDKKRLQTLMLRCEDKEKEIGEMKAQIEDTMRKRFGKVVDMENLETAVLNSDPNSYQLIQLDSEQKSHLSMLQKKLSDLKSAVNKSNMEKAQLFKKLTDLLKKKNDLTATKSNRHECCSRSERSTLELSVERFQEVSRSQKEQMSALRHELELMRCKMTSSRDLFPSSKTDPQAFTTEDSEATSQTPSLRLSISTSHTHTTPEIHIHFCQDPESDD